MNEPIAGATRTRVRAFAPGGVGNIGPGLDILGCALTGAGDSVEARIDGAPGVWIEEPGHPQLPRDATRHSSGLAALEVLRLAGRHDVGVTLRVDKRLPLAGGQGGSAASAVAGAVATNALIGRPLDDRSLVQAALAAEERVAGRHVDNIAPCLFGGILLIRQVEPLDFVRVPVPSWLRIALARPDLALTTQRAREDSARFGRPRDGARSGGRCRDDGRRVLPGRSRRCCAAPWTIASPNRRARR